MYDNSYGYNDYHNRNANQFTLPPQPNVIMVPPPPSQTTHSANAIDAHSGSVGQHFGAFGPPPPQS